jgi:hypothetical protein
VLSGELAAYDVLCSDSVVFTRQTLPGSNSFTEAPLTAPPADRAANSSAPKPADAAGEAQMASALPAVGAGPDEATAQEPVPETAVVPETAPASEAATAQDPAAAPETEEGA